MLSQSAPRPTAVTPVVHVVWHEDRSADRPARDLGTGTVAGDASNVFVRLRSECSAMVLSPARHCASVRAHRPPRERPGGRAGGSASSRPDVVVIRGAVAGERNGRP